MKTMENERVQNTFNGGIVIFIKGTKNDVLDEASLNFLSDICTLYFNV